MAKKLDPKEEARRAHNEKVREDERKYKEQINAIKSGLKEKEKNLETTVPKKVLDIIEDIIETQNKGVPLSPFQRKMVSSLYESFAEINSDELRKPRLISREDGMVIKDMRVLTPDGKTNFTDFKTPDAYENQTMETLLPLGETTYDLIDMIADTISENAKLIEELNKKEKKKAEKSPNKKFSEKARANRDEFQHKIMDLRELALNSKMENSEIINQALRQIFLDYNLSKDSTLTPLTDGQEHWLGNVPIVNEGDLENIDPKAETVDAHTQRKEMFKIDYKLPNDVDLVKMLPKNITEQLIEVLSRAVQENSELHNQLYKKEKIQRKFPTKLVCIIASIALAAGAAYGISTLFGDKHPGIDNETKQEDVLENEEEQVYFAPYSVESDIKDAELYLDQLKSYGLAINDADLANDIYQKTSNTKEHWLEEDDAQTYLGEDYQNLSYAEMIETIEGVLEVLKSDKTTQFIEMLNEKYDNKTKVEDEKYSNYGRLSSYNLTEEEYSNYQLLYNYADKFRQINWDLERGILTNKDFQKVVDNKNVKISEKEAERIWKDIGIGAGSFVTSAAIGSGLYLIVKNAKKKEEQRELERASKKDDEKEV